MHYQLAVFACGDYVFFIAVGTAAVVFGIAFVINRPGAVTVVFHYGTAETTLIYWRPALYHFK